MINKIKKSKLIILIAGLLSITIGIVIFTTIIIDYHKSTNFIKNSAQVEGYVYNVNKKKKNKYNFEYKYTVNNVEYKKYVSSMEFKNGLKENDKITIYYDKNTVSKNMISKPSKNIIYIAIMFLMVFMLIGIIDIIKYIKYKRKNRV